MNHSKYVLFVALILSTFGATLSPLRAANSEWDDVAILKPSQQIRVELNDEAVTLQQSAREQTLARKDILRVYAYSGGKNHRLRNIVIGAAMGAILATPVVLANRNRYNSWWHSSAWVWLVFVPAGAGLGATIPTAGWHEVYRAH